MTVSVGIDPGLAHTGLAVLVDGALTHVAVHVTTKTDRVSDTQARLAEVLDWVSRQLANVSGQGPDVVVVEWPMIGGRNPGAARATNAASAAQTFACAGGLIGLLRGLVPLLLAPVPSSWRAAIGGGKCTTEYLHAHLDDQFGVTARVGKTRAPHAIDAVGLALYGHQQLAGREPA